MNEAQDSKVVLKCTRTLQDMCFIRGSLYDGSVEFSVHKLNWRFPVRSAVQERLRWDRQWSTTQCLRSTGHRRGDQGAKTKSERLWFLAANPYSACELHPSPPHPVNKAHYSSFLNSRGQSQWTRFCTILHWPLGYARIHPWESKGWQNLDWLSLRSFW